MFQIPERLAFSTDGPLYSYYLWIRRVYGQQEVPDKTYLCPAARWVLLGSVALIPLAIPMMVGWFCSKVTSSLAATENRVSDAISQTSVGRYVSNSADRFVASPVLYGAVFGIACVIAFVGFVGILAALGFVGWHVKSILEVFVHAVCLVGWSAFWLCHGVGFLLVESWTGIAWFFTNGSLWLAILKWGGIGFACLSVVSALAMGLGYLMMAGLNTAFVKQLRKERALRLAAAALARSVRADRLSIAKRAAKSWTCAFCKFTNNWDYWVSCESCGKKRPPSTPFWGERWFTSVHDAVANFMNGGVTRLGNTRIRTLGFFSMILAFFHSKTCPAVYFVSPQAMKDEATRIAADRMASNKSHVQTVTRLDAEIANINAKLRQQADELKAEREAHEERVEEVYKELVASTSELEASTAELEGMESIAPIQDV